MKVHRRTFLRAAGVAMALPVFDARGRCAALPPLQAVQPAVWFA